MGKRSNFSFSPSVFKRFILQTRKNQGLFWKGLTVDTEREVDSAGQRPGCTYVLDDLAPHSLKNEFKVSIIKIRVRAHVCFIKLKNEFKVSIVKIRVIAHVCFIKHCRGKRKISKAYEHFFTLFPQCIPIFPIHVYSIQHCRKRRKYW